MTAVTTVTRNDVAPLLENAAGPTTPWSRVASIWAYREMLANLIKRELKVTYKDSVFGFLWTLMNPLLWLAVPALLAVVMIVVLINRHGEGAERLAMLNPITPVVTIFQRVLYNPTNFSEDKQVAFTHLLNPSGWYVQNLLISLAFGLFTLVIGYRVFTRIEGDLGEEL